MDLCVTYSHAVEVRISDNKTEIPTFLSTRKPNDSIFKRSLPCQIWVKLNSTDMIEMVEKKIKERVEEKTFQNCHEIYKALKAELPYDLYSEVAVRLQDNQKWTQVGDFDPHH